MSAPCSAPRPDWVRCGRCGTLHYGKKLARALNVCHECGHHQPMTAQDRIATLTDEGSFAPMNVSVVATDALAFTDSKPYAGRLAKARAATGLDDAVLAGTARIGGCPVAIAAMDFRFMGGSLGSAVGEMITLTAETALHRRIPFIVVTASGGARMQEGVLALLQMAKVSQAIATLKDAGLLTVSVVTDPTYGGVAASFATNCDVVVMEQGARMGFAGPRVIEQTIRQKLPADFQTADFLLAHGQVDAVQSRAALPGWLARLLAATGAAAPGRGAPRVRRRPALDATIITDPARLDEVDAWQVVGAARGSGRPTTLDYLAGAFSGFVELHGDRAGTDCPSVVAGFALLEGEPVAVIGQQKGHDTKELVARNFGMPLPSGYRKALRVMRLAATLAIPIVTIVDTPGAFPGLEAEAGGQAGAIADSILGMFGLRTPVVTVVTGEGGSGGALALAVADRVLMLERSTYSVISPEGCSAILWGDAASAPAAARALRITARELLGLGLVDGVVPEPAGGAAADPQAMVAGLGQAVARVVAELRGTAGDALVRRRRERYRSFGTSAIITRVLVPEAAAV
ncbi:MAG TPA: acetyl-CoA carboxylase, carboxyltransferase subunit beta [Trebonia sp.]|nr:acetyl-CoA carboxylase, carboxyltransferase subunit beta [Trebonia sp.]